jgi:ankyrin repeat protein
LVRPLAKATNGAPAAAPAVAAANAESRASALSPNQQLLQAAGVGDALRMEQLLASGAQVDARDDQGRTALMLAVQHRQHLAATKLIELGARRSLTDPQGLTALDMARALGDEALLRLLAPAQ